MDDYTRTWGYSFSGGSIKLALICLIIFFFPSCNGTGRKNIENLKKVGLDMSTNEVIRIMGEPADTVDYFEAPVTKAYYYEAPFLNFDGIYIGFDSSNKVNLIKADKGDIKKRKDI